MMLLNAHSFGVYAPRRGRISPRVTASKNARLHWNQDGHHGIQPGITPIGQSACGTGMFLQSRRCIGMVMDAAARPHHVYRARCSSNMQQAHSRPRSNMVHRRHRPPQRSSVIRDRRIKLVSTRPFRSCIKASARCADSRRPSVKSSSNGAVATSLFFPRASAMVSADISAGNIMLPSALGSNHQPLRSS